MSETLNRNAGYDLIALVTFDVDPGAETRDKPITADWGPSILVNNVLYPGHVKACDKPIFFGESGQVRLAVMTFTGNLSLTVGQQFGLCAGPQRIASGRVLEIL
ncbi:hypothetical protein [Sphingopyxis macrogoltabida]|uniref:Uncharacterized protein n=1 Tax=Sphingopyxis macrogoltabida TaxID=33050 RepID=A0AAC8Z0L1_SPHMC|nr:hypothetical protein [Sphingopyxis macrogoltabida]ALJ13110.1 hypothetical protein LH19_09530 [Sphingopyxis macrogoltabida]AMU89424.1 hypothetical protein ATM17_10305 [Sphingopyxis macrogoltabida]